MRQHTLIHTGSLILALGTVLLGAGAARADSLLDTLGPRELALGESLRAAGQGRTAAVLNPAGVALVRSYTIEGIFGRMGDDTTLASMAVCDAVTSPVAACLTYDYFKHQPAGGERKFHQVGVSTSVPILPSVLFGITQKYVWYDEAGTAASPDDNSRDHYAADAGLIVKLGTSFSLAGVGYNLVGADDDQNPRAIGSGVAFGVGGALLVAADARWNLESGDGRYGSGIEYFFSGDGGQQGVPIRAGYVYDSTGQAQFVTGGLGYVTPRVGIDAGIRKQVSKGDDLAFQFGLRFFLPN